MFLQYILKSFFIQKITDNGNIKTLQKNAKGLEIGRHPGWVSESMLT